MSLTFVCTSFTIMCIVIKNLPNIMHKYLGTDLSNGRNKLSWELPLISQKVQLGTRSFPKLLSFFQLFFSPPLFQLPCSNSIHEYFFAIYLRQRYLINGHILALNKSTFLYTKTSQLLNEPITYLFPFNSNVTKIFLVFLKFEEEFHFPFSLISTKVSK